MSSEMGKAPCLLFSHRIPLQPLAGGFAPTCLPSHPQIPAFVYVEVVGKAAVSFLSPLSVHQEDGISCSQS